MDTHTLDTAQIERRQGERRKENRLVAFQDRRVEEYRRAADRHEAAGNPLTAQLWRNEAYLLERELEG